MKNNKPLKDTYDRKIEYLRISITDKCNLRCVYCMPSGMEPKFFKETDVLTDDEIIRFVRIARKHGLRKVRITGGEPLMRRNITGLLSSIKNTGIRELGLTTNGIELSNHADELKKAGLDRVNISLDTLEAERYREITKGGDINLVLKSIKKAEKAGLVPIKINVVPIRGVNDDEILSFARLTFENDYHIRFIEFMPATCSGMWKKEKCISSEDILKKISTIGSLERFEFRGQGPSRNYRLKGARGVIGVISPISDHFCSFCNRLRLTADGKIRPCLFSKERIDIRTPMRNGAEDAEIEALLRKAVKIKPQRHKLNEDRSSLSIIKTMSKIGG